MGGGDGSGERGGACEVVHEEGCAGVKMETTVLEQQFKKKKIKKPFKHKQNKETILTIAKCY